MAQNKGILSLLDDDDDEEEDEDIRSNQPTVSVYSMRQFAFSREAHALLNRVYKNACQGKADLIIIGTQAPVEFKSQWQGHPQYSQGVSILPSLNLRVIAARSRGGKAMHLSVWQPSRKTSLVVNCFTGTLPKLPPLNVNPQPGQQHAAQQPAQRPLSQGRNYTLP